MTDLGHANDEFENLSVKELRQLLHAHNIDTSTCIEKQDFIFLVNQHNIDPKKPPQFQSQQTQQQPESHYYYQQSQQPQQQQSTYQPKKGRFDDMSYYDILKVISFFKNFKFSRTKIG